MAADTKFLDEDGWKAVAAKFKLKDKELQKALFQYWALEDDDFEWRIKWLGKISSLADALKKSKEVAAVPDVVKYLTQMDSAADGQVAELNKAKALAAKTAAAAQKKTEADAKKEEQGGKGEEDEEEQEEGDTIAKLTNALRAIKTAKEPYYCIVCDAKPYGLIISKKDIRKSAQARKDLAALAGGSTRAPKTGTCVSDSGKLVFDIEKPPAGMAQILQKWIKDNTGMGVKVMVGAESAEDAQEPADAPKPTGAEPGAPPQGGAKPGQAEDAAAKAKAEKLGKASEAWHGTRKFVDGKIDELKKAIKAHYADGHPDLLKEIDKGLAKLDGVLDKLDHRLADSLARAGAAKDEAARKAELQNAKKILADYIVYVKSEPLIGHMDSNPFGVKTELKPNLAARLAEMAKAVS
jgi:hypothetical protein